MPIGVTAWGFILNANLIRQNGFWYDKVFAAVPKVRSKVVCLVFGRLVPKSMPAGEMKRHETQIFGTPGLFGEWRRTAKISLELFCSTEERRAVQVD